MNLVVDCSFIMSSILSDEQQLKVDNIYHQISNKVYNIFAPAVFFLECNNVLISSLKKQRITKSNYEEYLHLLNTLPINIDKFCSSPESLHTIAKIATKYGLTSYDASYLELSLRLEAKIATLDNNLVNSCKIANIESII
ncbi:type II toxin-antitoxin system VapC family toxin [Candidatus Tisiphia endosymbiont of Ditula angustiorana]|uniref:type II toxin-antitoxin system VapC family toxin n=1 Tax=Candidatus Tisiphia endosymbiont of Ditula angustiorana TaxID=3066272 RepID=UPI003977D97D